LRELALSESLDRAADGPAKERTFNAYVARARQQATVEVRADAVARIADALAARGEP
jgi:hypothetical protein